MKRSELWQLLSIHPFWGFFSFFLLSLNEGPRSGCYDSVNSSLSVIMRLFILQNILQRFSFVSYMTVSGPLIKMDLLYIIHCKHCFCLVFSLTCSRNNLNFMSHMRSKTALSTDINYPCWAEKISIWPCSEWKFPCLQHSSYNKIFDCKWDCPS